MQQMQDSDLSTDFPAGWTASLVEGHLTSWFEILGEAGGNYKTLSGGPTEVSLSVHTFLAGPRFTASNTVPVAPFVQLLVGVARGSFDVSAPNVNLSVFGTNFA